ncbi:peptide ABC transporter permease [Bradyrhizobium sp.]|uniref:peptide ABC transporter permease n=1 Tax=Bradyrhizobium sp. TaxID=376 RepID=UPI003C390F15
MVREGPAQPAPPPKQEPYPADKARGGDIMLDTPLKRGVFAAGLAGAVVLVLVLGLLR